MCNTSITIFIFRIRTNVTNSAVGEINVSIESTDTMYFGLFVSHYCEYIFTLKMTLLRVP
jgi:hypothetical protein